MAARRGSALSERPVDRYAVVGHPVGHSWSPFIHGLFARQLGIVLQYSLLDVEPTRFRRAVVDFFVGGGKGLNVTVPHKQAAFAVCTEHSPRAARAAAVNTIALREETVLYGDNTDGAGLVRDLKHNLGIELPGRRILVLGAGGATRGVLGPLLAERPQRLLVANRRAERALELARQFEDCGSIDGCGFEDIAAEPWDLIINATSAGLTGETPVVAPAVVGPATVCYDMSYGRDDTPFLAWSKARGAARAHKGWGMLVEQAAESFELWHGVRPETRPVLAALLER
jgi:shikimate dehydrogenase